CGFCILTTDCYAPICTRINPARSFGVAVIFNDEKVWDDHVLDILGVTVHRSSKGNLLLPVHIKSRSCQGY
ncbi:hypothetical protein LINPERHAP2_LOCUS18506, partial [Linum perenne]